MMPEKFFMLATALLLAGCAPELDQRVSTANGAALFAENCAACHGAEARGYDGPSVDWPTRAPPDLTLLAERNGGTFPDIRTLATIYGSVGHTNPDRTMPEFGAGDLGPMVIVELDEGIGTPVPADLIALSEFLQSVQR